jgi:hypothetical protein
MVKHRRAESCGDINLRNSRRLADHDALMSEIGVLVNGTCSNECFGLSLSVPAGWQVNEKFTPAGKAKHLSADSVALLYLFEGADTAAKTIVLQASTLDSPSETTQDFISKPSIPR